MTDAELYAKILDSYKMEVILMAGRLRAGEVTSREFAEWLSSITNRELNILEQEGRL